MRIAVLAGSAVREEVHRAADQALAVATSDLGLASVPRIVKWFGLDDGPTAGDWTRDWTRHLLGYIDDAAAQAELESTGRLIGFVYTTFGKHGDLWIRKTVDPAEAAEAVLHEAAHSYQVGQTGRGPGGRAEYAEREADAQAYAARRLPAVTVISRHAVGALR